MAGRYSVNVLPSPTTLCELNFAAQQRRDFAADREAQSRPAVFAGDRSVGLLERLEDDAMLVGSDSDTGIFHRERDDRLGIAEDLVVRTPSRFSRRHVDRYAASFSELERIRQQILQNLLQPSLVGIHTVRQCRIDINRELQALVVRDLPERPFDVFRQVLDKQPGRFRPPSFRIRSWTDRESR